MFRIVIIKIIDLILKIFSNLQIMYGSLRIFERPFFVTLDLILLSNFWKYFHFYNLC